MKCLPALLGNDPIFESKVPISRPVLPRDGELSQSVEKMFESGVITKGHHLRNFEEMLADHLGVKHAVAVSNCTSGLMLTYKLLGLQGDVVVPSFTFMATVGALRWAGLRPVFADIDPMSMNLDPIAAEAAITSRTTAIVAVHNSGNPAEIVELQEVADRHGLRLIFDAAHGFGSSWQGRPIGAQGDAQVFSASPTKLVVAGEGGIVATNDGDLADKVRIGREYGNQGDYDCAFAGLNARMPEFNALLGQYSLRNLEAAVRHRNELADLYRLRLRQVPGVGFQEVRRGNRSSYKDFSVTIDPDVFSLTRDELALALGAENIDTRKYYEPPVHRQSAYREYALPNLALPNTELLASRVLCLPIWSDMDVSVASRICSAVERSRESAEGIRTALK
jgi:dTDP-4-amino-4,6-dideoxygalactose transaminase